MTEPAPGGKPVENGMPRWLVRAIAAKLALVIAITGAVVWWANR